MTQITPIEIPGLRSLSAVRAMTIIGAVSVTAVAFLFWLIYFRERGNSAAYASSAIAALPALNAGLNALSATFLTLGYLAVRRRNYNRHVTFMLSAVVSSALFLVSYIVYHGFHGDTKFLGAGFVRPVYFFILISHIVLSVVVVPLILTSLWLSLAGRMATHKRVSRWTLPIWLYVSVTGVLIFVMLKLFNPAAGV